MATETNEKIHMGRNVKRFREMLGIKQDALAVDLNISQQTVSLIEQKETIDDGLLEKISKILKVPADAIKNLNETGAINIISNTFSDNNSAVGYVANYNPTFNPLDKYIETMEENKKLYERLLGNEREKNELLQKLLDTLS